MHWSFRQTDHSKLFFIRMGLIFPVCLIYTLVTETLFKEILMKKKEEELILAEYQPKHSHYSPLQGIEWLCTGMMERLTLQKAFLRAFPVLVTCTGCCKEKLWPKHCLFPTLPLSCPSFLAHCWRNLGGPCLPGSWVALLMPLPPSPCACRQFLSTVSVVELWLLGTSSHSASATGSGSRQQPCQCMVFRWSFSTLFLFLPLHWESASWSIGNILCIYGEKNLLSF